MLQHIYEDPEAVKKGMQIVTDSLMTFVQGCIRLGVDGFYTSTQGGRPTGWQTGIINASSARTTRR
jgi:hypothetical protein